jgi:predicted ABC-type ATPase
MPDLNKQFEDELIKLIARNAKKIKQVYESSIVEVALTASKIKYKGQVFQLKDYPNLQNKINKLIEKMHLSIYSTVVNSIQDGWDLSNQKNNILVDKRLAGKNPTKAVNSIIYDPNKEALKSFITRKEKGLNLSERVWNSLDNYKTELEAGLGIGISEGKSAAQMASQLKQYLNQPDKLFRKVRDKDGNLQLSKAAREYKPGRGVYRSSYKNALRLTITETSMGYRAADHERWKNLPFITGIEIRLSNRHPMYDICDELKGKYPKGFKFVGWHPHCLCAAVPIQMSDEEYNKYEDALLAGEELPKVKGITEPPKGFIDYVEKNRERIESYKSTPYWYRDNKIFQRSSFNDEKGMIRNIQFAKRSKQDTFDIYTDKDGKFTPERQKLHDDIVNHFVSQETTQNGTIFTMGGAPANGKSTLTDAGLLPHPEKILKIDPDEIKKRLPEYAKLVNDKDPIAAAFAHEESSYLGKRIISESLKRNNDFLIDGVGDGSFSSLEKKIKSYQSTGKRVRSDYVSLDTDLSIKLAEARARKTGREVPLTYIKEMNSEISKLVPQLIENKTINELYLWDTNINGTPRLILSQIDGELKIYNQGLYDNFLKKAIENP